MWEDKYRRDKAGRGSYNHAHTEAKQGEWRANSEQQCPQTGFEECAVQGLESIHSAVSSTSAIHADIIQQDQDVHLSFLIFQK